MKAICVMFDSLNRHFLPPYGCDWVHAPNFQRLADKSTVYDNNFVGSLPCIPARRELHTGRYNFLHRSWGPLEPFDDSMPQMLKDHGVYTHLVTDHMHYFEEGGATYHQRYNSWELARGQQADPWKVDLDAFAKQYKPCWSPEEYARDRYNRTITCDEDAMPQAVTFTNGIEFIKTNHAHDNWFLTVETFDPHEPFYVPQKYKDMYPGLEDSGLDWPGNDCMESDAHKSVLAYASLLSMCDHHLGRLLDCLDRYSMWDDTMVILCTDHGYMLGEHGFIGKVPMPGYRQVCNTPLMIWNSKTGQTGRSSRLTQTIDIPVTILEYFGVEKTKDMQGLPIREDSPEREAALFGVHSLYTCCTDGRYIYMKAPDAVKPVYNYTLMPTHMHSFFSAGELSNAQYEAPLSFTKGYPVLKAKAENWMGWSVPNHDYLFDLDNDPEQNTPLEDARQTDRMRRLMTGLMRANAAPGEYYDYLGLREYIK